LRRNLRSLSARFGKPDRDRLLAALGFGMPARAGLQLAALRSVDRAPHVFARGLTVFAPSRFSSGLFSLCHRSSPRLGPQIERRPNANDAMARTRNTKKKIFASAAALPAMPPNPRMAAMMAIMNSVMAQFNMTPSFLGIEQSTCHDGSSHRCKHSSKPMPALCIFRPFERAAGWLARCSPDRAEVLNEQPKREERGNGAEDRR